MNRIIVAAAAVVTLTAQAEMPVLQFTLFEDYARACGQLSGQASVLDAPSVSGVLVGVLKGGQMKGASEHQLQMLKIAYQQGEREGLTRPGSEGMTTSEIDSARQMAVDGIHPLLKQCATISEYLK